MPSQISSLWSFSDEDAAHLTSLSKIGQEIQLFLSTTEVAVQQISSGSAMSSWTKSQKTEKDINHTLT